MGEVDAASNAPPDSEPRIIPWTPEYDGEAERIVAAVFAEYGFGFYPEDYDSDLRSIEEVYLKTGGMFRLLLVDREVVGSVAVKPLGGSTCELKRLYLLKEARGRGLGGALLNEAIQWAREKGFREMVAWSDTRFADAHAAYLSRGFEHYATRPEHGPDPAEEYGFRLTLGITHRSGILCDDPLIYRRHPCSLIIKKSDAL